MELFKSMNLNFIEVHCLKVIWGAKPYFSGTLIDICKLNCFRCCKWCTSLVWAIPKFDLWNKKYDVILIVLVMNSSGELQCKRFENTFINFNFAVDPMQEVILLPYWDVWILIKYSLYLRGGYTQQRETSYFFLPRNFIFGVKMQIFCDPRRASDPDF